MARQSVEAYGEKLDDGVEEIFKYVTTHNDGVFSVYSGRNEKGETPWIYYRTS